MSDREWYFYITDMIQFAENVLAYSDGFEQENFAISGLNFDATIRNLELIGEAATHIPKKICEAYPSIPWRKIIATRNRLIHAYLGIDIDTVWSIIHDDIPVLIIELQNITDEEINN